MTASPPPFPLPPDMTVRSLTCKLPTFYPRDCALHPFIYLYFIYLFYACLNQLNVSTYILNDTAYCMKEALRPSTIYVKVHYDFSLSR